MTVRTLRGGNATVFWDSGCTSNFIREEFAKKCGFNGTEETLCVTTLGGVVTDYKTVIAFKCSLLDENGYIHYFEAYGMKSITGTVSKIEFEPLKQLFPHSSDKLLLSLERGSTVDILIGLGQASWQPSRAERAVGGGDLWIHRGLFGACVGGRHLKITEGTRRNNDLFFVNHVYHSIVSTVIPTSHELEFCQNRVKRVAFDDIPKSDREVMDVALKHDREVMGSESIVASRSLMAIRDDQSTSSENIEETQIVALDETLKSDHEVTGDAMKRDREATGISSHVIPDSESLSNITASAVDVDRNPSLPIATTCVADGWIENYVDHNNSVVCHTVLTSPFGSEDLFFKADSLGTIVEPKCGGCTCGKCPVPGSKYSYKEQQEFDLINNNLFRKGDEKRWYTAYPWRDGRDALPKNDKAALQGLHSLEKMLKRNPEKAAAFNREITDMVERGAAIQLSEEEISSWNGAYHYLPMVLVKGKRYRICFDAARSQCGAPAFNKHLYKGPDRFVNNIAAVILGFRNGRYAAVADLSKFHNQIFLVEEDIHMQRFLWRGMNTDIPPQTYAVCVNNFGVTSANCVATCALHKSADISDIYPKESAEIKTQTYIDDELVASPTMGELLVKTKIFDKICDHAGMKNKGWTYSGDHSDTSFAIGKEEGVACDKVLGMMYSSKCDVFTFKAALRFRIDGKEVEITCLKDFLEILFDLILTRRIVLSNVARIFDPIGFLCPILLQSKILMREMWTDKNIGWDDPISAEMSEKWIDFLSSLLNLVDIAFQRSLWPDSEVEGLPILIIFSDGSILAFGAVAYIRWKLKNGGYWARLIMAKCKIAPKNMLSIPRMELNGAVLGNRVKNFILKDTNMKFSKVYQLVDSSTVLGYAQKEYGAFKPYEGIRVAEIQSTNEFEGKRLKGFAWVAGPNNPADWCTKPRRVENLLLPFWPSGPPFIYENECDWPIKFTYKKDDFEGMLRVHTHVYYAFAQIASNDFITRLVIRCSSWKKIYRTFGWMLRVAFPVTSNVLLPSELSRAKAILLKYAQKDSVKDLLEAEKEGKGRFRKLAPLQDDDGLYRVGSRMKHHVPFTHDKKLPVSLPERTQDHVTDYERISPV